MNKLVYLGTVALLFAGFSLIPATAAEAASPSVTQAASDPGGVDVGWPQCSGDQATAVAGGFSFLVVGVNHGLANNDNPCRDSQIALASQADPTLPHPEQSLYINTGNPGLAGAWWPSSNRTQRNVAVSNPLGTCKHTASEACAYIYGYSMASDDVTGARGNGALSASSYRWWLDVEIGNTWSSNTAYNRASLAGMIVYLSGKGASVGIYSTPQQLATIAGKVTSTSSLAGKPTWLAGATAATASADCVKTGLTPHSVITLVQYISEGQDRDVFCAPMAATTPTLSGGTAVGNIVTAAIGTWQSGATLQEQWNRNGVAITGATGATHKLVSADAGTSITVTVTATESGFARTLLTSASLTVPKALTATPTPTLAGTATVGHTLTATAHSWKPAPVHVTYQWKRNGVAIAGATARTHKLVSADAGTSITVVVTGSKIGYTTIAKTSAAKAVR